MPKPQKFCIYCGGTGMSKEHMWPDWLRAYVPRNVASWGQQAVTLYRTEDPKHIVRHRTGDPHAAKLRIVCEDCNTGWMSRLQEATKTVLVPLLEGREVILYPKDQQLLARWCAIFVMTNEFAGVDRTKIAVPPSERRYVMERDRAPSNWGIWLGRYKRSEQDGLWAHHSIPISDSNHIVETAEDNTPIANTQATTFSVGELYVTVLSSALIKIVRRWHFGTEGLRLLRQIWPVTRTAVRWPPPYMMGEEASLFSGAFFRAGTGIEVPYGKLFSPDMLKRK